MNSAATRRQTPEIAAFQVHGRREQKTSFDRKDERRCSHCGKDRHTVDNCYELIGYPDHWNIKKKDGMNRSNIPKKHQPKAATVQSETSPMPGLSMSQYSRLVQLIGPSSDLESPSTSINDPSANMTGKIDSVRP